MEENPYAKHLEGHELNAILSATPGRLQELLGSLSDEVVNQSPGPNKWSLREITTHLADTELVWSFRIRRYAAYDFATALATFTGLRTWNLRLLATLTEADRRRPATHPERGSLTLQVILETMAGHDLHHLRLLEGLLKRETKEAVPSPS